MAETHNWDRISRQDVAALLTDDWSGAGPIRLDATLELSSLAAAAPTFVHARAALQSAHRGRRPRDAVAWMPALLEIGGLLPGSGPRGELTPHGEELLAPARAGELFAHLFRTFFRHFNLAYLDRFPEIPELQDLVPHWCWVLLGPVGAAFTPADLFVQVLIPRPLSRELDERAAPARLRHLIQTRVFDSLAGFGLLEPKPGDYETAELGDARFRPTALFRRFLSIDVPHARVPGARGHLRLLH